MSIYGDGVRFIRILDKMHIWQYAFCIVANGKERKEPCTVNLRMQVQNSTVKKPFFVCFVIYLVQWPVKPLVRVDS